MKFSQVNKGQDIFGLHKISVQDDDLNFSSSHIFIFPKLKRSDYD